MTQQFFFFQQNKEIHGKYQFYYGKLNKLTPGKKKSNLNCQIQLRNKKVFVTYSKRKALCIREQKIIANDQIPSTILFLQPYNSITEANLRDSFSGKAS